MVKSHIHRHGSIETDMDAAGRQLLERYRGVLQSSGYPVLRLEEMYGYPEALAEAEVHGHRGPLPGGEGPRGGDAMTTTGSRSRSRTLERSFRSDSSRDDGVVIQMLQRAMSIDMNAMPKLLCQKCQM